MIGREWTVRAVLLMAVFVATALYGAEQRKRGAALALVAVEAARADSLETAMQRQLRQLRVDTVRLVRLETRWDSSRVRYLEGTLDSLRRAGVQRPETVKVEVPVHVLITADSTILACRVALRSAITLTDTCGQRVASLERQIDLMPKPRSAFWVWTERGLLAYASFRLGQSVGR